VDRCRAIAVDIRRTAAAEPAAVWRLLGDSSTWPSWTPIESCDIERPGSADGLGEVRAFKTGRVRVREEIVECRPGHRLSYTLLSGLPIRDYRADIDLTPRPGGTEIRWHTTFTAKVPGSGRLYRWGLAEGDAAVRRRPRRGLGRQLTEYSAAYDPATALPRARAASAGAPAS
jgi:uncharacterized protein YndB with AHSA1/START domain